MLDTWKRRKKEIGFFIKLKMKNLNIPILMTKYNVMNESKYEILNITLNNENTIIKLVDRRYQNKKQDIAIIEIEENKNDHIIFLEIDDNLFNNKELENYYYKKPIYTIQCNDKKELSVSFGRIEGIVKSEIRYSTFFSNLNSKGSPIFDLSNNKIIGLHENNPKCYFKGKLLIILKDINKIFRKNEIIKLKFDIDIIYSSFMFAGCKNIISINLDNFNTEYITNMEYMFYELNVKKLNLFSFNTERVKYMNNMFSNCEKLKVLDLSFFDMFNV